MILERLKAGTRNSRTIDFHSGKLNIRLLSTAEIQQARIETLAYTKANDLDDESQTIENALRQLYLATSDEDGNRCAETVDSFRGLLTRGEREYLVEEYLFLENECMPSVPGLKKNEFEDLLAEVKKSPDSVLNASNIYTLKRVITYLESQQ